MIDRLLFTRAHKGNAVVVLDRDTYVRKVKETLNDANKFQSVGCDQSLSKEKKINSRLAQLKKEKKINQKQYDTMFATGSSIPVLYCSV